jgi:hypothetical protein
MPFLTPGITASEFQDLFLESEDFPEPMEMIQDERDKGPDLNDAAFRKYRGLFAGFRVCQGSFERPVWRVVDGRWAFPSIEKAEAYHVARLKPNSEGQPLVPGAEPVGEHCSVFGGTARGRLFPDMLMTAYCYIFRVHNIVVKLFIAQGLNVVDARLNLEIVASIARRIELRINEHSRPIGSSHKAERKWLEWLFNFVTRRR